METAWERHGLCELASAVLRQHVGDLPAFGEWQGHGRVTAGEWHENDMGVAWERHGMCELAFNVVGEWHGMCQSDLKLLYFFLWYVYFHPVY
jgi:hypothetical protein